VEHLSSETLNKFVKRELDVAETLNADRHLANCSDCRHQLMRTVPANNSYTSLLANLRKAANQKIEHISFEEISGFVKRELDAIERENVESHTAVCASCAKELSDLQMFAVSLNKEIAAEKQVSTSKSKSPFRFSRLLSPKYAGAFGVLAFVSVSASLLIYMTTFSVNEQAALTDNRANTNSIRGNSDAPKTNKRNNKEISSSLTFRPDGNDKTLVVPKDTKTIFLQFGVANRNFTKFKASIKKADAKDELTKLALDALEDTSADYFTMSLSADALKDGEYRIVVNGVNDKGEEKKIKEYLIKVMKEK